MATPKRVAVSRPRTSSRKTAKATGAASTKSSGKRSQRSATNIAIATELAPAVAIALLDKTEQAPGSPAPALDCLAAGATSSEEAGKVRVQLMFENGAVLPVEMSIAAGQALSNGLAQELPKK